MREILIAEICAFALHCVYLSQYEEKAKTDESWLPVIAKCRAKGVELISEIDRKISELCLENKLQESTSLEVER